MLKLFNTLTRQLESFKPANENVVRIFTCGPSVYQRSHIGNFRTFMFEDVLVRYLEYSGYRVRRGLIFTDVEDKAIEEAEKGKTTLKDLVNRNIRGFLKEVDLLKMKIPDRLSRASEHVFEAVKIIQELLDLRIAYWHRGSVYFDPLKFPGFGRIYGLDLSLWPKETRRFHKDTYPGTQWNLGDFILWHGGAKAGSVYWETAIGRGRPSWNIQDASILFKYIDEPLSIFCGGWDNLFRHHDYTRAILESVRPYPMTRYWLHGQLLLVKGRKMSKSLGNIYYTDTILNQGYSREELRFFLLGQPYGERLNYSDEAMKAAAEKLRGFKRKVKVLSVRGHRQEPDPKSAQKIKNLFSGKMDDNLNTKAAFNRLSEFVSGLSIPALEPTVAAGFKKGLQEVDAVLQVLF
jgi:cysteinyl-tRNA synthetase